MGFFDDVLTAPAGASPDAMQGITIRPVGNGTDSQAPAPQNVPAGGNFFADVLQQNAPAPSLLDRVGQFAGGIVKSLANTASAGGQAAQIEMGQPVDVPDAATTQTAIEKNVTGPLPLPASDDRLGKFLATSGEFVGNPSSYILPGSVPAKIGMAVLSGLGSEAGGQLAEGTPYEGPARFAGAVLGGGAAAKIAQPGMVEAAIGPAPSAAAPSIDALKTAAKIGYEAPEVAGVTLAADPVANKVAGIMTDLASDGIHPVLAPKTFGILNDAAQAPADAVVTVDNLQALRRTLGKAALSIDPTERYAAQKAMAGVDKIMTNMAPEDVLAGNPQAASDTLKTANANYSAAKTSEALDKRFNKAEDSANAANSGMNLGNRLRQQAAQVLNNDKARRGLKPEEITMLQQLVDGTPTRNAIRYASNLFGGGGGLGAMVAGEVGHHLFGKLGLALAPIGHILKHLENHLTVRAAGQIAEAIRMRSPLGVAIQSSAEKWDAAREALISGPNSAKFAAFSMASRNLANNLAGAGVTVHPTQLIRSVQGPMYGDAEGKQK